LSKITSLKSSRNRNRVDVFLDGDLAFTIDRNVVLDAGLWVGEEVDGKQLETLHESDLTQRCLNAAKHFISYRPRSESEVKQRMHRQGYPSSIIVKVIERLKERGLIDDLEFARYWKENRLSFNPKSKKIVKYELRRKGVPPEIAEKITSDMDDEASAYQAANKKARTLNCTEFEEFKEKLGNYLKWRGFGYELIERLCDQLWQKKHNCYIIV
jgi:regulatory protein